MPSSTTLAVGLPSFLLKLRLPKPPSSTSNSHRPPPPRPSTLALPPPHLTSLPTTITPTFLADDPTSLAANLPHPSSTVGLYLGRASSSSSLPSPSTSPRPPPPQHTSVELPNLHSSYRDPPPPHARAHFNSFGLPQPQPPLHPAISNSSYLTSLPSSLRFPILLLADYLPIQS